MIEVSSEIVHLIPQFRETQMSINAIEEYIQHQFDKKSALHKTFESGSDQEIQTAIVDFSKSDIQKFIDGSRFNFQKMENWMKDNYIEFHENHINRAYIFLPEKGNNGKCNWDQFNRMLKSAFEFKFKSNL